jgi:hypothetical protein
MRSVVTDWRRTISFCVSGVAVFATGVWVGHAQTTGVREAAAWGPAGRTADGAQASSLGTDAETALLRAIRVAPSEGRAAVASPLAPKPKRPRRRTSPIAGKGMWIYEFGRVAGGNPLAVARLAKQFGLTHIYVRVGSGKSGLSTLAEVARVLPYAHERGIKVIAWYFPYFGLVGNEIEQSARTVRYRYAGHSFDGFAADIESAPGSLLSWRTAYAYSKGLRAAAPRAYLVAVPPRPTPLTIARFPYDAVIPHFDAVAPMVYWGRFGPGETVARSIGYLRRFGKPIAPVGQAYDMGPEGGPVGKPPGAALWTFMAESKRARAVGVSFWSWQHANYTHWRTIRAFRW